jgi:hypothetical protein
MKSESNQELIRKQAESRIREADVTDFPASAARRGEAQRGAAGEAQRARRSAGTAPRPADAPADAPAAPTC